MTTDNLTGQMTIIDLSGISIWNGKREVNDPALKERIKRCHSVVSIKAEFPQDKLRVFSTIKQRIRRALEDEGYPFLSGFAIPQDRTQHVMDRVNRHIEQAAAAKADFLSNYDSYRQTALDEADDQNWKGVLDEAMLSQDQVESRIVFEVVPLEVSFSHYDPSAMDRKLGGLREQILGNAIRIAQKFLEDNQNPSGLKKKSCGELRVLKRKVQGFKFLNGVDGKAISTLLDHALKAVDGCPSHTLPESVYWQVTGPVGIIADENRIQRYLSGEIKINDVVQGPVSWTDDSSDGTSAESEPNGFDVNNGASDTDDSVSEEPLIFDLDVDESGDDSSFSFDLEDDCESEEEAFTFEFE